MLKITGVTEAYIDAHRKHILTVVVFAVVSLTSAVLVINARRMSMSFYLLRAFSATMLLLALSTYVFRTKHRASVLLMLISDTNPEIQEVHHCVYEYKNEYFRFEQEGAGNKVTLDFRNMKSIREE